MARTNARIELDRDERGIAALEFALVLPALALFLVGILSIYTAAQAGKEASRAASTLSDLATRVIEMDDFTRDAMFDTAAVILSRFNGASTYTVSITSVINPPDPPNQAPVDHAVDWSEATATDFAVTDDVLSRLELPSISEGESFILVVVTGEYHAPVSGPLLQAKTEIVRTSVRRPRFVAEVPYVD
ncbi:MAG: TadE/TadG family type IV pilus assembly protein [Pseudomonadota bacterium]